MLVRGSVTGLVGTNGSGKTSLARVISSKALPGFPSQELCVEYVSSHDAHQDRLEATLTPGAQLERIIKTKLSILEARIEELEQSDSECSDSEDIGATAGRIAELCQQYDDMKSESKRRIDRTLTDLGFTPHLDKKMSQLSCGWRYKCRLAGAFFSEPDLLIIDEPSFLDATATQWLAAQITRAASPDTNNQSMVVLISHKEALLERVCDRIIYINSRTQTLSTFKCGYQHFRSTHLARVASSKKACGQYDRKVDASSKSLKQLQDQLQRRERNLKRKTTENSDQRFIKGKNKEAKQKADRSAAAKLKQLKQQAADMEKLRRQAQRERVKDLKIDGGKANGTLVTLENVSFAYGGEGDTDVFHRVNARLEPGEHVLLCGPNGCGKSTLLSVLLGLAKPTQGRAIIANVQTLFFPQTSLSDLIKNFGRKSSIECLISVKSSLAEHKARLHLGAFGLGGSLAFRPIATLSAGQRVRLWLAKETLVQPRPCLLVMDEISENLDVETRKSLSDLLNGFEGAVILASHDEDFCNAFKPTCVWNLSRSGVRSRHVSEPASRQF